MQLLEREWQSLSSSNFRAEAWRPHRDKSIDTVDTECRPVRKNPILLPFVGGFKQEADIAEITPKVRRSSQQQKDGRKDEEEKPNDRKLTHPPSQLLHPHSSAEWEWDCETDGPE